MEPNRTLPPSDEQDIDRLIANYGAKLPEKARDDLKESLTELRDRFLSREAVLERMKEMELEPERERSHERER